MTRQLFTLNDLMGHGLLDTPTAIPHRPGMFDLTMTTPLMLNSNPQLNSFYQLSYRSPMWIAVSQRFKQFYDNIELTGSQTLDAMTKRAGVVSCLNRNYFGTNSSTDNSLMIGSWGKGTAIRPPRDVDLYFLLPANIYTSYQSRQGNRQSTLLQEVKTVLANTYSSTDMRGDGQVVCVNFDSYFIEVVPAFQLTNGRYWICNTHNGGSYKETDPVTEINLIENSDRANNRNLRPLIRMLKAWQYYCSVPIKSFQLEILAIEFLAYSPWRLHDCFWFDWIIRDFFAFLIQRANTIVFAPGTCEPLWLGDEWLSRATTAYGRALKACKLEQYNYVELAGEEWQKIFGQQIPKVI